MLTCRSDVYPKGGEGAYALANPQNLQQIFRDGQLVESLRATYILSAKSCSPGITVQMRATILDSESLRLDVIAALVADQSVAEHMLSPAAPWSKSTTGLLLYKD